MCLTYEPADRPSFEELQEYLGKELDMNDFSHAYEKPAEFGLQAMEPDGEDQANLSEEQP